MIYIAIPVHDEATTLGVLLWKIRKVMAAFGRDYEIVILDDASTDGTGEILERYRRVLPIHLIRAESRIGYGRALERLVREVVGRSSYPKRDVLVTLQGDFTEDPEDLVGMVKTIEGGADLVAGRLADEAKSLPRAVRVSRYVATLLLGKTLRKAPVGDPLSGFRAYRVIVLKKVLRDLPEGRLLVGSDGWGANLELMARALPHTRRIEEAPYRVRGFSHRDRISRFRPIPALRSLVPFRGMGWPSLEANP